MTLSLDHIVIAVHDLDRTFADYGALGFQVIRGGEHADGASANVLVVFQDGAYLELIAFMRPRDDNRWSEVLSGAGEGFVDHALLPGDIAADVAAAQKRGLDISDPIQGGRNRPDGERLEWQTARSPGSDVPFLCGDVTPRRLRVQEGEVRTHPNGVTGVASLTIAVRDLARSATRYASLLDLDPPKPGPDGTVAFRLGNGTEIILAAPSGEGPLADALAARGEGPCAVAFRGPSETGELDPSRSHGAKLSIVAG